VRYDEKRPRWTWSPPGIKAPLIYHDNDTGLWHIIVETEDKNVDNVHIKVSTNDKLICDNEFSTDKGICNLSASYPKDNDYNVEVYAVNKDRISSDIMRGTFSTK
jgi:hypothetical protein